MAKIVCQLSGGADSILATIKVWNTNPRKDMSTVFIDYGQICAVQEYNLAKKAANKLFLKLKVVRVENLWTAGGMISGEIAESADIYTPLRNVALLGITMSYAESINADIIITGSKGFSKVEKDPHSFYDSTIAFYKLMEAVWNYTTERKNIVLQIIPILAEGRETKLSKKDVYRELEARGFKFEDSWSCFRGLEEECGTCHNCKIKRKIYYELNMERLI